MRSPRINIIGKDIPIPKFSEEVLSSLCVTLSMMFSSEPMVLRLTGEYIIVGDLHGNLRDLIRLFIDNGMPPNCSYLFLGDYVDRGSFSLEVITLLFALKFLYPQKIYMLRGNHEILKVNAVYGFRKQVMEHYSDNLYKLFNDTFNYLPVACIISNSIFAVHGGISPSIKYISEIDLYDKPILPDNIPNAVNDLLWSDPSEMVYDYIVSTRGEGHLFGNHAINKFLSVNKLKYIIRAHQYIQNGVEQFGNQSLFTVFSASNYEGIHSNLSGVLYSSKDGILKQRTYEPIEHLSRDDAIFSDLNIFANNLNVTNPIMGLINPKLIMIRRYNSRDSIKRLSSMTKTPILSFRAMWNSDDETNEMD